MTKRARGKDLHKLLKAIQRELDGVEWDSDTLDRIAVLLDENGYKIRDAIEVIEGWDKL